MRPPILPTVSATIAIALFSFGFSGAGSVPGVTVAPRPPDAARSPRLLDGKTFVTQAGEQGKQASIRDTIVFRDGRFLSVECGKFGFGDAPYRETAYGSAIRFHAETRSPTHGTMVWDGIVRGDAFEATNTWTRDRWYWKIKKKYWFKGQRKN